MVSKRKSEIQKWSKTTASADNPSDDDNEFMARTALRPTVQAAITLAQYGGKEFGNLDLFALIDCLSEQTGLVIEGNLQRGEAMLVAQAHTLDAIFNNLAQRAINAEYVHILEQYLKLGLRAQSQCRATWETLAIVKSPPVAGYVGQANIAYGQQQVNNTAPAPEGSHAREKSITPSKLLEEAHDERVDSRATGAAGKNDPAMAAVEDLNRTKVG